MSSPIVALLSSREIDYKEAFHAYADTPETHNRDLIASILLDAVEQSFAGDDDAREWLRGIYAQSLLMLLDISPQAALEHLGHRWQKLDGRLH